MANYIIKVEEIVEREGERFSDSKTVYQQSFATENSEILENIIKAVNEIE